MLLQLSDSFTWDANDLNCIVSEFHIAELDSLKESENQIFLEDFSQMDYFCRVGRLFITVFFYPHNFMNNDL